MPKFKQIENALCDTELCTSCMACVNACRHQAIVIDTNNKGFYHPKAIIDKCVDCGACANVCPVLSSNTSFSPIRATYACWNKDSQIRRKSSSGGLFSSIDNAVIENGGIVYGVKLNKDMEAVVSSSDIEDGIEPFMGSKYVQCHIESNTYRNVKASLNTGRTVLYTGTACQIAGLKNFLKKEYDNLLTLDFLCHGVPSPTLFKEYIKWLENKHKKKIIDYQFRDKKKSWHLFNILIKFEDGTTCCIYRNEDYFYQLFLKSLTLQNSCFNCQYTRHERVSDITMGDYWVNINKIKDDDNGMSIAIINTEKGEKIFNQCKVSINCRELNKERV